MAKPLALTLLALLGGACVVYAPVPVLAVSGIVFAASLWLVARDERPYPANGVAVGGGWNGSRPRVRRTVRLVSAFLLLWWLASISPIVVYSPRDVTGAAQASVGGSLQYQVLLIAFGCVGGLFLPRALKRLDSAFRWVAALWALHVLFMFVSLAWSIYPPLTFRNAVAFVLVSVGSFGLGAGFYGGLPDGRNLFLRHVFAAGVLSALALLLPLPLRWQAFALLDPSQRLDIGGNFPAFVVAPVICALLVFVGTAVLGVRTWRTHDWLWVALLVLPLLVLKSRGPVLYAAVALVVFYLLCKVGARNRVLQAGLFCATALGTYAFYSGGAYGFLVPYLTRGNVESTMTLTGRLPLWDIIISEIQNNPWLGVGFAAFWNPQNYPYMEQRAGFPVVSAHNGFLDTVLGSGVIGLAIFLAFCLCSLAVVAGRARGGDPLAWLAFLLLLFYLLQNLTSSVFTEFYEITLIVMLATLGLLASTADGPRAPPMQSAGARRLVTPRTNQTEAAPTSAPVAFVGKEPEQKHER